MLFNDFKARERSVATLSMAEVTESISLSLSLSLSLVSWTKHCWPTVKNLHSRFLHGHWIPLEEIAKSDDLKGRMVKESQGNLMI